MYNPMIKDRVGHKVGAEEGLGTQNLVTEVALMCIQKNPSWDSGLCVWN
jgi:hypothetical protein